MTPRRALACLALAALLAACSSSSDTSGGDPLKGIVTPPASAKTVVHQAGRHHGIYGHDIAARLGIAENILSWAAPSGDLNGDGRPDLLIVRHLTAPDPVYLNEGDRFRELLKFPAVDRHDCAFGDVNRDGRTDMYCSLGADRGQGFKANELWIQSANGTFHDEATAYDVVDPEGRGRYVSITDFNGDHWPDIFLGNLTPRADGTPIPNHLYLNDHGHRFVEKKNSGVDVASGSICLQILDYNEDGRPDIFQCGNTRVYLWRNDGGGHFTDVTSKLNLLPVPAGTDTTSKRVTSVNAYWWSGRLVDLDGDGYLDAVGVRKDALVIQHGGAQGFGVPIHVRTLDNGWRVEFGDIDKDGRPDLYVLQTCFLDYAHKKIRRYPDYTLRNQGDLRFTPVPMDRTDVGCADSVDAIDYNGDGRTEFVVLDGRNNIAGPVRVLDYAPRRR